MCGYDPEIKDISNRCINDWSQTDVASDSSYFVRKLNKAGTKFEKLGGGWGKFDGPRTGSYWGQY